MAKSDNAAVPEWLEGAVETIFSWVILMPISVIISGKILAKIIDFPVESPQVFKIPIKILNIEAEGGEVILGFAGFIITLTSLAVICGKTIYLLVKTNFGIDPGQFNAICMFSSFTTVIWSTLLFIIALMFPNIKVATPISESSDEHNRLIAELRIKAENGDSNE